MDDNQWQNRDLSVQVGEEKLRNIWIVVKRIKSRVMHLKEQEHFWIIQCDILGKYLPQSCFDGYGMYCMITLQCLLFVPLAGMNMDVGFEQSKTKNKLSDWSTLF